MLFAREAFHVVRCCDVVNWNFPGYHIHHQNYHSLEISYDHRDRKSPFSNMDEKYIHHRLIEAHKNERLYTSGIYHPCLAE